MSNHVGSYIVFADIKIDERKTDVYGVFTIEGDIQIGIVKWFSKWRRYAFFPSKDTCYEQVCLRDIANFCEQLTKEYKEKLKHD